MRPSQPVRSRASRLTGAPPARLGTPAMNVRVGANPARVCAVGLGTNPPSTATSRGQRLRRSSSTHGLGKQAVLARVAGCPGRRRWMAADAASGVGGDLGALDDIW